MKRHRLLSILLAATGLALLPAAPGQARVFHTPTFHAFKGKIGCAFSSERWAGSAASLLPFPRPSSTGTSRSTRLAIRALAVLRCTNADGNGFTLTPKAYAVF